MNRSLRRLAVLGLFALGASSAGAQELFNLQYNPSARTLQITPTSAAVNSSARSSTYRAEYGLLFGSLFVTAPSSSILTFDGKLPTDSIVGGIVSSSGSGTLMSTAYPDPVLPRDLNIQSLSAGTMSFGSGTAFLQSSPVTLTFSTSLANSTYMPANSFSGGTVSAFTMGGTEQSLGTYSYSVVPEPSTYAAIAGALGLGYAVYRRRRQAAAAATA
jgi:hypothetical protein